MPKSAPLVTRQLCLEPDSLSVASDPTWVDAHVPAQMDPGSPAGLDGTEVILNSGEDSSSGFPDPTQRRGRCAKAPRLSKPATGNDCIPGFPANDSPQ